MVKLVVGGLDLRTLPFDGSSGTIQIPLWASYCVISAHETHTLGTEVRRTDVEWLMRKDIGL